MKARKRGKIYSTGLSHTNHSGVLEQMQSNNINNTNGVINFYRILEKALFLDFISIYSFFAAAAASDVDWTEQKHCSHHPLNH